MNTPTKIVSESTINTPSTGATEIASPYDIQKQRQYELAYLNFKRKNNNFDKDEFSVVPATVITDRYGKELYVKKNDELIEYTTNSMEEGPYYYNNGTLVPYVNLNAAAKNLSLDFEQPLKRARQGGKTKRKHRKNPKLGKGKGKKSRKNRKTRKQKKR